MRDGVSGNISSHGETSSANKGKAASVESAWDSMDTNCKKFIPRLLLSVLQDEQDSTPRDEAMDILMRNFSMPNEDKYLKSSFSKEGVELWKCLFKSKKDYVVKDAFRLLQCLFTSQKDALFAQMRRPSDVFDEVLKLWWNRKFTKDVGDLLKSFIELGTLKEVSDMFEDFEILDLLVGAVRSRGEEIINDVAVESLMEYQVLDMFRSKMITHYRPGYELLIKAADEYGHH